MNLIVITSVPSALFYTRHFDLNASTLWRDIPIMTLLGSTSPSGGMSARRESTWQSGALRRLQPFGLDTQHAEVQYFV
jgi:hypothetical protein